MKSAFVMRYGDVIGSLPKRRWDIVIPPDFLESYAKYACAYMSVLSPMIFIALLLAPTVPSEPSPQNLQHVVPSGVRSTSVLHGARDVFVTLSSMPMVKPFLGSSFFSSSYTANT